MTDALLDPLSEALVARAMIEVVLLGIVGGALGCWVVLYGLSYGAESFAHALFPGLVLAALTGVPLLLGSGIGLLLAAAAVAVASRAPNTEADTAVAVVVTTMFGAGVLLALSPQSPPGVQALLFGDILAVTTLDIAVAAAIGLVVLLALRLLHPRLLAVGFDQASARSLGVSPALTNAWLLVLLAVAILVAVQGLGNLLVIAILIGPAATARLLTRRLWPMIVASALIAALAGIGGIYLSYYAKTAAGASIAACIVAIYLAALSADLLRRGALLRRA
jgi:ABC-type Mn2+/Zn2+ transport system permease subunit